MTTSNSSSTSNCSICFESHIEEKTLPCNHTFGIDCINRWLETKNTCPLCRAIVNVVPKIRRRYRHENPDDYLFMMTTTVNNNVTTTVNNNVTTTIDNSVTTTTVTNSPYDEHGNLRNRRQNYLDLYIDENQLEYEELISGTHNFD